MNSLLKKYIHKKRRLESAFANLSMPLCQLLQKFTKIEELIKKSAQVLFLLTDNQPTA